MVNDLVRALAIWSCDLSPGKRPACRFGLGVFPSASLQDKDYTIPLLERWVHRTKLQDAGPVPGDEAGVGRACAPHLDELPGYATS